MAGESICLTHSALSTHGAQKRIPISGSGSVPGRSNPNLCPNHKPTFLKAIIFVLVLLPFGFLVSCQSVGGNSKQNLLDAFKNQKVNSSWNFEMEENDSTIKSAFKNNAIGEHIVLQAHDTNLVIGYFSYQDKRTHSATLYKSQLVRQGSLLYIITTDPSGRQIDKIMLPEAKRTPSSTPIPRLSFASVDKCEYDFLCSEGSKLQCLANEICSPVRAEFDCCSPDGSNCYSASIVINPTRLKCNSPIVGLPPIVAIE